MKHKKTGMHGKKQKQTRPNDRNKDRKQKQKKDQINQQKTIKQNKN